MCDSTARRVFARAELRSVADRAEGIFELDFIWRGPAPEPGQFFLLRPVRGSAFLGRPISVYAHDPATESLRFLVALRGKGTAELRDLRPGEEAELAGPLGNVWPIDFCDPMTERVVGSLGHGPMTERVIGSLGHDPMKEKILSSLRTSGKPAALVGGGIGIAPLSFLASRLPAGSYDFFAGFRSRSFGLDGIASRRTVLATEDGCEGCRGRIPDLLEPSEYGAVFACGPEAMLRAVAAACAKARLPCALSLERRMACGVGACLGCAVATKGGVRRCCADGPVFDAEEVFYGDD